MAPCFTRRCPNSRVRTVARTYPLRYDLIASLGGGPDAKFGVRRGDLIDLIFFQQRLAAMSSTTAQRRAAAFASVGDAAVRDRWRRNLTVTARSANCDLLLLARRALCGLPVGDTAPGLACPCADGCVGFDCRQS